MKELEDKIEAFLNQDPKPSQIMIAEYLSGMLEEMLQRKEDEE